MARRARCTSLSITQGSRVRVKANRNARKHGGPERSFWGKIHIGIDEQTLEIRAVEITDSKTGDAQMLPHLPNQIPHDQEIGIVTADSAHDTGLCHNTIADREAIVVIPPRRNSQLWKKTSAGAIGNNDAARVKISGLATLDELEWLPPRE